METLAHRNIRQILGTRNPQKPASAPVVIDLRPDREPLPTPTLAELFDKLVPRPEDEPAWVGVHAHASPIVSLHTQGVDTTVVNTVSTRQAWQFGLLPLRREEDTLVIATTRRWLSRALPFAEACITGKTRFVLADESSFRAFLDAYHPWPAAAALPMWREPVQGD